MKTVVFTILFLILHKSDFAQTDSANAVQFIKVGRHGYSISCPSTWRVDSSGLMGTDLFLLSSKEDPLDIFSENLNILVTPDAGVEVRMDQLVETSRGQILQMLTDPEMIADERFERYGQTGHRLVFAHTQGKIRIRVEQEYYVSGSKAIILTLSLEDKNAARHSVISRTMLESFSFKSLN